MHERIMSGLRKIDQVFDRVLGNFKIEPLSTMEELQSTFPHKKGCSQSQPLKSTDRLVFIPGSGGFDIGIHVRANFLSCDECHTEQQFEHE